MFSNKNNKLIKKNEKGGDSNFGQPIPPHLNQPANPQMLGLNQPANPQMLGLNQPANPQMLEQPANPQMLGLNQPGLNQPANSQMLGQPELNAPIGPEQLYLNQPANPQMLGQSYLNQPANPQMLELNNVANNQMLEQPIGPDPNIPPMFGQDLPTDANMFSSNESYPNEDYLYDKITSHENQNNVKIYICAFTINKELDTHFVKYIVHQKDSIVTLPFFEFTGQPQNEMPGQPQNEMPVQMLQPQNEIPRQMLQPQNEIPGQPQPPWQGGLLGHDPLAMGARTGGVGSARLGSTRPGRCHQSPAG